MLALIKKGVASLLNRGASQEHKALIMRPGKEAPRTLESALEGREILLGHEKGPFVVAWDMRSEIVILVPKDEHFWILAGVINTMQSLTKEKALETAGTFFQATTYVPSVFGFTMKTKKERKGSNALPSKPSGKLLAR